MSMLSYILANLSRIAGCHAYNFFSFSLAIFHFVRLPQDRYMAVLISRLTSDVEVDKLRSNDGLMQYIGGSTCSSKK